MKKVLGILITLVAISMSLFPAFHYSSANGAALVKNRVVMIVYDDSGSMKYTLDPATNERIVIDNWKYASYSLQSLAALLAPDDRLYVTRMSQPDKIVEMELSLANRQLAIADIQGWSTEGNTPFAAVLTATSFLQEAAKSSPDSEFWLVVLTDGIFNGLNITNGNTADAEANLNLAHQELQSYQSAMDSQGRLTRSALVTIEQYLNDQDLQAMTAIKKLWKEALASDIIESKGQQNIIESINEVAALITDRDPESSATVNLKPVYTDSEVQFKSYFPIKRVTLLEQVIQQSENQFLPKDQGKLTVNGDAVNNVIAGSYEMATPIDPSKINLPILGRATHYLDPSPEGIMNEGEYRITLNHAKARQDQIQILVEPALDFELSLHKQLPDGSLAQNEAEYFFGSRMIAQVKLVKNNTKREPLLLEPSAIAQIEVSGLIGLHNEPLTFTWDDQLQAFKADFELPELDQTSLTATVHISGFYKNEKALVMKGLPSRTFGLEARTVEWSGRVDRLEQAAPLRFYATENGQSLSKQELAEILPSLQVDTGGRRINFDISQQEQDIVLTLKEYRNVWLTATGHIPIKLTLDGKYPNEQATASFMAHIEDISWWEKYGYPSLMLLLLLLLIWWLIGIIRKPRFRRQSSFITVTTHNLINGRVRGGGYEATEPFRSSWWSRWMVPYRAEASIVHDLTFKAGPKGDHILLPKETQMPEMKVSDTPLSETAGRRDIRIYSNDEIVVRTAHEETHYKFCKN